MTRQTPLRSLLILLLAASSTTAFAANPSNAAPPLPKNPATLLALAAQHNGLAGPNLKPWHVKVSFLLYDKKGKPTQNGIFEEWWAAPHEYKFSFNRPGNTVTIYMTPKGSYEEGKMLVAEFLLEHWLLHPLWDNLDLKEFRLERRTEVFGQMKFDCVTEAPKPEGHMFLNVGRVYCMQTKSPILRFVQTEQGEGVLYRSIARFQGRYLGNDLVISNKGVPIITARLLSGQVLGPPDRSIFALPPEAKGHVQPVYNTPDGLPGLVAGHRISGRDPIYPPAAKLERELHETPDSQPDTVKLKALIGTDGNVHNLKVISSPSPMFSVSALNAVKTWRFTPYKLAGHPIQIEIIIIVNYGFPRGRR